MTAAQSSVEALRIAARAAEEKQGTNLFAVDASDAMGLIDGFLTRWRTPCASRPA